MMEWNPRMSVGLMALLDDIAGLAKVAAASIDDVVGHAAKAGAKSAGVVIDDTAVTPRYMVGFSAQRELPIIAKIARGSLRNKLIILLPVALLLSYFADWAITPLLMLGGAYLCFEGAEKVYEVFFHHAPEHAASDAPEQATSAQALEDQKVSSAIRTDFILSAEIMAIALAAIPEGSVWINAIALALVGIGITALVYGAVAIIVKADDVGLALANNPSQSTLAGVGRRIGRGLVKGMPGFLSLLATVGTAAMIWVGGGIVSHGLESFGVAGPAHLMHDASVWASGLSPVFPGFVGWFAGAVVAGLIGLAVGLALIPITNWIIGPIWRGVSSLWAPSS